MESSSAYGEFTLLTVFTHDRETQEALCCVKRTAGCFSLASSAGERAVLCSSNQVSTQKSPITTPGLRNTPTCPTSLKASCTHGKISCVTWCKHFEVAHKMQIRVWHAGWISSAAVLQYCFKILIFIPILIVIINEMTSRSSILIYYSDHQVRWNNSSDDVSE